ncbi:hypothetical protein CAEBREN_08255 [Caenorhabditis brenneri]|uniref:Uncharacterized protein n=1 Tax=Caenorhabditis brenneri TaxID=135651 RepID=G0NLT9_CAEBE|nr:hypothetical protein CAEBREN_08255 [Caenorhabditis brenneri]
MTDDVVRRAAEIDRNLWNEVSVERAIKVLEEIDFKICTELENQLLKTMKTLNMRGLVAAAEFVIRNSQPREISQLLSYVVSIRGGDPIEKPTSMPSGFISRAKFLAECRLISGKSKTVGWEIEEKDDQYSSMSAYNLECDEELGVDFDELISTGAIDSTGYDNVEVSDEDYSNLEKYQNLYGEQNFGSSDTIDFDTGNVEQKFSLKSSEDAARVLDIYKSRKMSALKYVEQIKKCDVIIRHNYMTEKVSILISGSDQIGNQIDFDSACEPITVANLTLKVYSEPSLNRPMLQIMYDKPPADSGIESMLKLIGIHFLKICM